MATGGRRRGRVLIFVAIILILLVVLAWAVLQYMKPVSQPSTSQQPNQAPTSGSVVDMEKIVISTQAIKRGAVITDSVIDTIDFPRSSLVQGAFITKKEDVVGKRAKIDLEARIPLNPNMLVDSSVQNSPAAFKIPRGQVAISIPVNSLSSVSYGLQAGDHVNVIASLLLTDLDTEFQSTLPNQTGVVTAPGAASTQGGPSTVTAGIGKSSGNAGRTEMDSTLGQPVYLIPSESPRPRVVSQTLIQDAVVLQVGQFSQTSSTQTSAAQPQATPQAGQPQAVTATPAAALPTSITLIVNPQDAVTLNYLILAGGSLNLAMRSAGDDQRIATEAVTLQFLLDQYNIPNPAKLPYGLSQRVDKLPSAVEPPSALPTVNAQANTSQNP